MDFAIQTANVLVDFAAMTKTAMVECAALPAIQTESVRVICFVSTTSVSLYVTVIGIALMGSPASTAKRSVNGSNTPGYWRVLTENCTRKDFASLTFFVIPPRLPTSGKHSGSKEQN